jgi:hypothetical protein
MYTGLSRTNGEGLSGATAKRFAMLLKRRTPGIETRPVQNAAGLEHLTPESIAVLRWLCQRRVEYVVVGGIGRAIRGDTAAGGPVAIVPAPYGRNYDRLAQALNSAHARRRVGREPDNTAIKMTAEKLAGPQRWTLRAGMHDIDVEGHAPGLPRYQELLYEAGTFELEPGLKVEVASHEDLEHFDHVRRTGFAPEIRITRAQSREPAES